MPALTQHDEDLMVLPESTDSYDDSIAMVEGLDYGMDSAVVRHPQGAPMGGLGALTPFSVKNIALVGLALLGAWLLVKKLRKK